ncbi:hypothetical protein UVI_02003960 [Ustilaginoidea virens]|uniref:Uncharacterized protein n=1 Tax=Ustilaginoidea virens TaxID=1159556 RepID=A0A1B5KTW2_USTVR|nr:hypothetical protein UVI_02003960 [Ustilaginoidea virens]
MQQVDKTSGGIKALFAIGLPCLSKSRARLLPDNWADWPKYRMYLGTCRGMTPHGEGTRRRRNACHGAEAVTATWTSYACLSGRLGRAAQ